MTEENKATLTKVLAIVGFCVTIALIIWLIVAAINRAPGTFGSLANLADSINLREEISELTVTLEKTVVNSGEPFQISWTDTKLDGTYRIGYTCAEGMLILFRDPQNTFRPIRCNEPLPLPADIEKLVLVASSTKDRFADVTFRVQFAESELTTPIEGVAKLTVVNAAIPVGASTSTATTTRATTTPSRPTATATTTAPTQPAPVTPLPVVPAQPITTIVYPQSDPNGFTDLVLTILPMGSTGAYGHGTVRFTIKNIGTKTSQDWSFAADLPSGNDDYASVRYAGLKPQEYMTFTMGFTVPDRGTNRVEIDVHVSGDKNNANNNGSVNLSR